MMWLCLGTKTKKKAVLTGKQEASSSIPCHSPAFCGSITTTLFASDGHRAIILQRSLSFNRNKCICWELAEPSVAVVFVGTSLPNQESKERGCCILYRLRKPLRQICDFELYR